MSIQSDYKLLERIQRQKIIIKQIIRSALLIALGVLCASIGLKGFLLPNNFIDGGAVGLALLTSFITPLDLSVLLLVINAPFLLLGSQQISYTFAIKSALAIVMLAVSLQFIHFPVITEDKLLIAIFGGVFLGAGSGLAIRGGAVLDGSEALAIYISKRTFLTVGDFVAIFNILLFSAAILFINIEAALYSMLAYFSASKTIDFLLNGLEEYIGVTIISQNAEAIRKTLIHSLGRGVTVYKAESGFLEAEQDKERKVLFCVVTRLEVSKLLNEIEKIDNKAFVVQHAIKDTKGGMIKKRPLH
jgi:uncharacterized membrane-anchored protein YitT (DUF2179 family)